MAKKQHSQGGGKHEPSGSGRWWVDQPGQPHKGHPGTHPVDYPTYQRARKTSRQLKDSKVRHRSGATVGNVLIGLFVLLVLIGLLAVTAMAA